MNPEDPVIDIGEYGGSPGKGAVMPTSPHVSVHQEGNLLSKVKRKDNSDVEEVLEQAYILEATSCSAGVNDGSSMRSIAMGTLCMTCGIVGGGSITVPYACALTGLWWGLSLIALTGFLSGYGAYLLSQLGHNRGQSYLTSYSAIAHRAYGNKAGSFVQGAQFLELIADTVLYLLLISTSMYAVFPSITEDEWVYISAVLLWFLSMFRTLKDLFWVTLWGAFSILLVTLTSVLQNMVDGQRDHRFYEEHHLDSGIWEVSTAIGIIVCAYGGLSAFPEIYASIPSKDRKCSSTCCTMACFIVTALYMTVAACCYTVQGDVLLNYPNMLLLLNKYTLTDIAICLFSLFLLIASRILMTPVWLYTEKSSILLSKKLNIPSHCKVVHIIWKFLDCCILCGVAIAIPKFEVYQSLIGGSLSVLLCFVLPAVFFLKVFKDQISIIQKGFLWLIIILSSLIGIFVTTFSLIHLVRVF